MTVRHIDVGTLRSFVMQSSICCLCCGVNTWLDIGLNPQTLQEFLLCLEMDPVTVLIKTYRFQ